MVIRVEDDPRTRCRHQAKRSLMNFFAVALAGCQPGRWSRAAFVRPIFRWQQATVVGRSERVDALSAAFLNAAGANVHDLFDTDLRTVDSSERLLPRRC